MSREPRRGGDPLPIPNPYVWSTRDIAERELRITVTFDEGTRSITGISLHRDPECEYTEVIVGVGAGNSPNASNKTFPAPEGDSTLPRGRINQLAQLGLATIEDFRNTQITAA